MSLFEFEKGDVIKNTIVSYPKSKFLLYNGNVVYNDSVQELDGSGTNTLTKYVPSGHISLYEMNIDRDSGNNDDNFIRPYVLPSSGWQPTSFLTITVNGIEYVAKKDNSGILQPASAVKDASTGEITFTIQANASDATKLSEYHSLFQGEPMYGSYPLSSSIHCDYINKIGSDYADEKEKIKAHALENTVNYYKYLSREYNTENLFNDDFNIISIPSIFYGNKINPGSVRLELIVTGSQAEDIVLSDNKKNGELIYNNVVHGVVLYNEGFIILRSNTQLSTEPTGLNTDAGISPRWIDFGIAMDQRTNLAWTIEFEGVTETPVVTMFTHARKNELNHSNNPSFLKNRLPTTSSNSHMYREEDEKEIRNVTKTDLIDEEPVFEKETYISKIAIYDDQKKIIGYARLARPIRKTENREITFKLKLDL